MLYGRLGDTPVVGSGFYAGPIGAIAATGEGEYNLGTMIARTAYAYLEAGLGLQEALDKAVALIPRHVDTGLVGITAGEAAASTNTTMPLAIIA
jgi:L-asparaginase/beta-aspartyl-peptidase (threonine type)